MSSEGTYDNELLLKYKMLCLNRNYIMYYFRLNEEDEIVFNDEKCVLITDAVRLSPIYALYNSNHLDWPYNWENLEKCGAPHCKWLIENKQLFLTNVDLYSGLELDSISSERIELTHLFNERGKENKVLADWVSGTFIIKHGEEKIDEVFQKFKRFETTEYSFIEMKDGAVIESFTVPANYNFNDLPEDIDPKLKKIIKACEIN